MQHTHTRVQVFTSYVYINAHTPTTCFHIICLSLPGILHSIIPKAPPPFLFPPSHNTMLVHIHQNSHSTIICHFYGVGAAFDHFNTPPGGPRVLLYRFSSHTAIAQKLFLMHRPAIHVPSPIAKFHARCAWHILHKNADKHFKVTVVRDLLRCHVIVGVSPCTGRSFVIFVRPNVFIVYHRNNANWHGKFTGVAAWRMRN